MKRSFIENLLKDLEADESVKKNIVDSIMTANGDDINAEKTKTETAQNDLKVKEGLIEELNTKIKDLGSVDIEKVKKEQFDLGKMEGSKEVENFKKRSGLEKALAKFKAKDVNDVISKLDMDKIKYNENYEVTEGLDEQVNPLKESHKYYFEDEQQGNQNKDINLGGNHEGTPGKNEPTTLLGALQEKFSK